MTGATLGLVATILSVTSWLVLSNKWKNLFCTYSLWFYNTRNLMAFLYFATKKKKNYFRRNYEWSNFCYLFWAFSKITKRHCISYHFSHMRDRIILNSCIKTHGVYYKMLLMLSIFFLLKNFYFLFTRKTFK